MQHRAFVLSLLVLVAAAGCFGGDDEPSPTPDDLSVATVTPAPEATSTPAAPPSPTAIPDSDLLAAVWLYDVAAGDGLRLFSEDEDARRIPTARFDGDTVLVRSRNETSYTRFDLEGNMAPEPTPGPAPGPSCDSTSGGVMVAGETHTGVACGPLSPDRRWMLYDVDAGETQLAGGTFPVWDQWVLNLETDERRLLQEGLVHCGGCDGRFGPGWSPSGRFVYFSELVSRGRVFLSDLETGVTRLLLEGSTEVSSKPEWSPAADLLLYPAADGGVVLEDFVAGTSSVLPQPAWPARFDESGRYVYGPAPVAADAATAVYDVEQGAVIATLSGSTGAGFPFLRDQRLHVQGDSFVALLEWGAGCDGAALYRGTDRVACLEVTQPDPDGEGVPDDLIRADLAPDGSKAAVARLAEPGDPPACTEQPCGRATIEALYQDPAFRPGRVNRYEVLLVDTATGATRVLAEETYGPSPPLLVWNDAGSHLLVVWPYETSYGP